MRLEHLAHHAHHMSRRQLLKAGAAMGAAAAVSGTLSGTADAEPDVPDGATGRPPKSPAWSDFSFTDDMFDWEAVEAGAWAPSRYGAGDERGSYNEVTEKTTQKALQLLDLNRPVKTYNMGEQMFNGFPAFPSTPPRLHEMQLYILGYEPPPGFGGIVATTTPIGVNKVAGHEERFKENATYQIATQIDGLNHVGVGEMFYNGNRGPDIATDSGTSALGNETMGPICTRGIVLDILGLKVANGETGSYFTAPNGEKVLDDNYRITLDDIDAVMRKSKIWQIRPGDVVLFHTGWNHLVRDDPERYLAQEPGPYLAETRYLAANRPAIIGSDTWGLENLDPDVTGGFAFPCHQLLLVCHGIRIGEAVLTHELAQDGVHEFVFAVTPQTSEGATAGNTPPMGLGQPGVS